MHKLLNSSFHPLLPLLGSVLPPADQLKKPAEPLSLRVSGHLLLGLSRIFAKKVHYLFIDSSEAFTRIKLVSGSWEGQEGRE